MIDWLFWLRVLNVAAWSVLLVYMAPAAWNAAFGKQVRRGDPMRLAVLVTSLTMLGFNLRWLIAPGNIQLWVALYILALANAAYIAQLARSYGRGGTMREADHDA